MPAWKTITLVFIGGGLGATCRYGLNLCVTTLLADTRLQRFPLGIFACNILGCFLIGCAFGALGQKQLHHLHPLVITGFLGGFTTFSTFGNDSHNLLAEGLHLHGILNILLSVIFGLFAVALGYKLTSS